MSQPSTIYINGKAVKEAFKFCFEDMDTAINDDILLISTRSDQFMELPQLIALFDSDNLDHLTDSSIYNLYSFREGVQFLYHYLDDLCDRGLLKHMFSSPFVTDEKLMELLISPLVLENCEDCFLDHLAQNPNIFES